jgi:hypothetical protein
VAVVLLCRVSPSFTFKRLVPRRVMFAIKGSSFSLSWGTLFLIASKVIGSRRDSASATLRLFDSPAKWRKLNVPNESINSIQRYSLV